MKYRVFSALLTFFCFAYPMYAQDNEHTQDAVDTVYLINQIYHFRVEYPDTWTAKKLEYPDPLPIASDLKADKSRRNFTVLTKDSPNWNAILFIGDDLISDARVYAHKVPKQSFDDFMANFKELLPLIDGAKAEVTSSRQDAELDGHPAYEIIYTNDFGSKTTKTLLLIAYENGVRYGCTFWAFERDFDKAYQHFKVVLDNFRILSDPSKK